MCFAVKKNHEMERKEFKTELERHKSQLDASIGSLQKGFEDFSKRNCEFYEFIESNHNDLEERLTVLERKVKEMF